VTTAISAAAKTAFKNIKIIIRRVSGHIELEMKCKN
jgi:hypothetical protein